MNSLNKMSKKIEINVRDSISTIAKVGKRSFDLGHVESVSLRRAFTVTPEGRTEIEFVYRNSKDMNDSIGKLNSFTKEVRGDDLLFPMRRGESVENYSVYQVTVENDRYSTIVKSK